MYHEVYRLLNYQGGGRTVRRSCSYRKKNGQQSANADQHEVESECKKTQAVGTVTSKETATGVIDCERFSHWGRLVRVTAWVLRMKKNLLAKIKPTNDIAVEEESLTPEELEKSRIFWIKEAQKGLEVRVKANELKTLSPFEDKEGIIRVGSPYGGGGCVTDRTLYILRDNY